MQDYRPISLLNSISKILTKILACRLEKLNGTLFGDHQYDFIKGRQAAESILIVNEVARFLRIHQEKGIILKLDFEKAFDSINWEFLFQTMKSLGFGVKWIGWIKSLLRTSRISVLVNGSPTKEFSPSNGVRQGDPLSPLLFNLAGEILNKMLLKANQLRMFSGISFNKNVAEITHSQYADDTILFIPKDLASVIKVNEVLQCFQLLSGLKINFQKSRIYSYSKDKDLLNNFASILGCKIGNWPLVYLGSQIGIFSRKKTFWKPLLQKFQGKLSSWKRDSLNQAGRASIIKSTLNSLPIYWFSLHSIPSGICVQLEKN